MIGPLNHAHPIPPCPATLDGFAKALHHIGLSRGALVLQGYEEPAGMRLVVAVVPDRPGGDVKNSAGRAYHVARVTDVVGEDRRARAGPQLQAAAIVRAPVAHGFSSRIGLL